MFDKKQVLKIVLILAVVAFVTGGCSVKSIFTFWKKPPVAQNNITPPPGNVQPAASSIAERLAAQSKIKKFNDLAELKEFLSKNANSGIYYGGMAGVRSLSAMAEDSISSNLGAGGSGSAIQPFAAPMMKESAADQAAGDSGGSQPAADYSETNNQVKGVDEPDIIKTDGKYIYIVSQKELLIVSADPARQMEIVSRTEFKTMPQDIFINGDKLAVFGQDQFVFLAEEERAAAGGSASSAGGVTAKSLDAPSRIMPMRQSAGTYFQVYDLSDRKNPKLVRDLAFEGTYSDARMIGDYAYFITNDYSYGVDDSPLPRVMSGGKLLPEPGLGIFYFDMPYQSYNFTRVSAINLKDDSQAEQSQIYLLSANQSLFVSKKNIYITYTKYLNEDELVMEATKELMLPKLSAEDQEKARKIEATEDFILSRREKLAKITALIEKYVLSLPPEEQARLTKELEEAIRAKYRDIARELEKTVIHKIAVDQGRLEYKTFGEVTGAVLNQFSMDEADGYFRIATTKNRTWSQFADEAQNESYSNLYVLDENLKVVGALENLAKGERIYSARFMGKRAYLVTFKQTDPLFAIDLSEPANPKVLGELKIPGFSNYLHPYDDTTLIGLGRDTDTNEWGGVTTKGLKLSLFDVSEVSKPKELDSFITGEQGSDSMALTDHHAFLFSKDKNLLVIPASIREGGNRWAWGRFTFSGAMVFDLSAKKFTLKGRIDHSDGGTAGTSEDWYGYNFYDNTVRRSLYVGDTLYTFSSRYLKANKLTDLAPAGSLRLASAPETKPVPLPEPLPMPVEPETPTAAAELQL